MALLSEAEIRQQLAKLPGWEQRGNALARVYEFPSFMAGLDFVNRVARVAEEMNHHPDIAINYQRVTLVLSSHDSGGITQRDIRLAGKINGLEERAAA